MRLRHEEIERLAGMVARKLLAAGGVVAPSGEAPLLLAVRDAIRSDVEGEAKLDEEVKGILEARARDLEQAGAEYQKMFDLVKRELARKRHIVL